MAKAKLQEWSILRLPQLTEGELEPELTGTVNPLELRSLDSKQFQEFELTGEQRADVNAPAESL